MIDPKALLEPISGDSPSGEDVRYSGVYDEIKEARRFDEVLDQGEWQTDIKKSDWDKVIQLAASALREKSKDLQIAVWLTEALIRKHGFEGLSAGLAVTASIISDYWETFYPLPDDGDLEYRIGPLEFLNEKLSPMVRETPVTDPKSSNGYSWFQWQESRQDAGEGKVSAEDFKTAAGKSSKTFYAKLSADLDACMENFLRLDAAIDEKFGRDAPGLSEMKKAIEDCRDVVSGIFREKGGRPAAEQQAVGEQAQGGAPEPAQEVHMGTDAGIEAGAASGRIGIPAVPGEDQGSSEEALWTEAQATLDRSGAKAALSMLLGAACSAASIRQQNRYRLMIAKLAIKAERPDISRPILEELYALIQELRLDQWESPIWIAEVIETYYQCLTFDGAPDEDVYKARSELYPKLCSKDITKALQYKKGG